jgi:aspartyl protease family protein
MLVDTGATVVALTGDDARGMGLDWDPDALAPVARGASGPVMGVPVTLPEMAVGDFAARDVRAVIVPEGLAVSLLGQSFLSQVPKVAIADDRLTLSE